MPINNLIQLRKGSSDVWASQNPVLSSGEPGYSIDNRVLKIGDGLNPWNTLGSLYVDQSNSITTNVFNKTLNTIGKFKVVYIDGGQGDQPTINLAIANGETSSSKTYGITIDAIGSMTAGRVVVIGALTGVNTDQFNPTAPVGDINGTVLYLSPTSSGDMTTTKPVAPYHMVSVGKVVRTHQNAGVVEVNIQNGFELGELHNVLTDSASDNGKFLQYNSSSGTNGLWIPSSSGNFTTLQVNGTPVSVSGHTHISSDITNFNSSVSGLLPVLSVVGGTGIYIGSTSGIFTVNYTQSAVTGYEIVTSTKSVFNVTQGYLSDNLNVFINGAKLLINNDYTANNGSTFTLSQPAISGDLVEWQGIGGPAEYAQLNHTHTTSNITNFNTGVSGLLSKTIAFFTAKDNNPPATNFATLDTRNSIAVLEFDASTDESAVFIGYIPDKSVLTNGLLTRISWVADTATSGNVRWGVQFEADGTDLDSDSFDTATLVTSAANATNGIETIAEITSTTIDSLADGDRFRLKIYRDADDATNDTMSGDAQLIAVEVRAV